MTTTTQLLAALLVTLLAALPAQARTRTTQRNLGNPKIELPALPPDSSLAQAAGVEAGAVTLRGYSKRASDSRESFLVQNNTSHRMAHVTLLMRYTTVGGAMLHERTVTVPVSLAPGASQLVSIASWDKQRLFYYHAGPRPRKSATPYRVAFRLLGYDIPVGQVQP